MYSHNFPWQCCKMFFEWPYINTFSKKFDKKVFFKNTNLFSSFSHPAPANFLWVRNYTHKVVKITVVTRVKATEAGLESLTFG
jgi:hypothetical protein